MNESLTAIGIKALGTLAVIALAGIPASAQDPLVREGTTVKISDHVWEIPNDEYVILLPNIGIVVGTRATLVVDAGLGPRNGEAILREVRKISSNDTLYVVTTHFHADHASGITGLGPTARLVIPRVQQEELRAEGPENLKAFRERGPLIAELLRGVESYPAANMVFDRETTLDLGGVHARIFTRGPMHTRGDTLVYIEEDDVLFSGEVAKVRAFPPFTSQDSSVSAWLATLEELRTLNPSRIVPATGPIGGPEMIDDYHNYLTLLQARVGALKRQGKSVEDVTAAVVPEFNAKFPGRPAAERMIEFAARAVYSQFP